MQLSRNAENPATYYVTVVATSGTGAIVAASSLRIGIDVSPPVFYDAERASCKARAEAARVAGGGGAVGPSQASDDPAEAARRPCGRLPIIYDMTRRDTAANVIQLHASFQPYGDRLAGTWEAFDQESGIDFYLIKVVKDSVNGTDAVPWTNVGLQTTVVLRNLDLEHGRLHCLLVRAYNGAEMWTEAASGCTRIDITPPDMTDASLETGGDGVITIALNGGRNRRLTGIDADFALLVGDEPRIEVKTGGFTEDVSNVTELLAGLTTRLSYSDSTQSAGPDVVPYVLIADGPGPAQVAFVGDFVEFTELNAAGEPQGAPVTRSLADLLQKFSFSPPLEAGRQYYVSSEARNSAGGAAALNAGPFVYLGDTDAVDADVRVAVCDPSRWSTSAVPSVRLLSAGVATLDVPAAGNAAGLLNVAVDMGPLVGRRSSSCDYAVMLGIPTSGELTMPPTSSVAHYRTYMADPTQLVSDPRVVERRLRGRVESFTGVSFWVSPLGRRAVNAALAVTMDFDSSVLNTTLSVPLVVFFDGEAGIWRDAAAACPRGVLGSTTIGETDIVASVCGRRGEPSGQAVGEETLFAVVVARNTIINTPPAFEALTLATTVNTPVVALQLNATDAEEDLFDFGLVSELDRALGDAVVTSNGSLTVYPAPFFVGQIKLRVRVLERQRNVSETAGDIFGVPLERIATVTVTVQAASLPPVAASFPARGPPRPLNFDPIVYAPRHTDDAAVKRRLAVLEFNGMPATNVSLLTSEESRVTVERLPVTRGLTASAMVLALAERECAFEVAAGAAACQYPWATVLAARKRDLTRSLAGLTVAMFSLHVSPSADYEALEVEILPSVRQASSSLYAQQSLQLVAVSCPPYQFQDQLFPTQCQNYTTCPPGNVTLSGTITSDVRCVSPSSSSAFPAAAVGAGVGGAVFLVFLVLVLVVVVRRRQRRRRGAQFKSTVSKRVTATSESFEDWVNLSSLHLARSEQLNTKARWLHTGLTADQAEEALQRQGARAGDFLVYVPKKDCDSDFLCLCTAPHTFQHLSIHVSQERDLSVATQCLVRRPANIDAVIGCLAEGAEGSVSCALSRALCLASVGTFAADAEWAERVSTTDAVAKCASQGGDSAALIGLAEKDAEGRLLLPPYVFLVPGATDSIAEIVAGMHAATLRELTNGPRLSMDLGESMMVETDVDSPEDFPRRQSHRMSELPEMLTSGAMFELYDNQGPAGDMIYDLSPKSKPSEDAMPVYDGADNDEEPTYDVVRGAASAVTEEAIYDAADPAGPADGRQPQKARRATVTDLDDIYDTADGDDSGYIRLGAEAEPEEENIYDVGNESAAPGSFNGVAAAEDLYDMASGTDLAYNANTNGVLQVEDLYDMADATGAANKSRGEYLDLGDGGGVAQEENIYDMGTDTGVGAGAGAGVHVEDLYDMADPTGAAAAAAGGGGVQVEDLYDMADATGAAAAAAGGGAVLQVEDLYDMADETGLGNKSKDEYLELGDGSGVQMEDVYDLGGSGQAVLRGNTLPRDHKSKGEYIGVGDQPAADDGDVNEEDVFDIGNESATLQRHFDAMAEIAAAGGDDEAMPVYADDSDDSESAAGDAAAARGDGEYLDVEDTVGGGGHGAATAPHAGGRRRRAGLRAPSSSPLSMLFVVSLAICALAGGASAALGGAETNVIRGDLRSVLSAVGAHIDLAFDGSLGRAHEVYDADNSGSLTEAEVYNMLVYARAGVDVTRSALARGLLASMDVEAPFDKAVSLLELTSAMVAVGWVGQGDACGAAGDGFCPSLTHPMAAPDHCCNVDEGMWPRLVERAAMEDPSHTRPSPECGKDERRRFEECINTGVFGCDLCDRRSGCRVNLAAARFTSPHTYGEPAIVASAFLPALALIERAAAACNVVLRTTGSQPWGEMQSRADGAGLSEATMTAYSNTAAGYGVAFDVRHEAGFCSRDCLASAFADPRGAGVPKGVGCLAAYLNDHSADNLTLAYEPRSGLLHAPASVDNLWRVRQSLSAGCIAVAAGGVSADGDMREDPVGLAITARGVARSELFEAEQGAPWDAGVDCAQSTSRTCAWQDAVCTGLTGAGLNAVSAAAREWGQRAASCLVHATASPQLELLGEGNGAAVCESESDVTARLMRQCVAGAGLCALEDLASAVQAGLGHEDALSAAVCAVAKRCRAGSGAQAAITSLCANVGASAGESQGPRAPWSVDVSYGSGLQLEAVDASALPPAGGFDLDDYSLPDRGAALLHASTEFPSGDVWPEASPLVDAVQALDAVGVSAALDANVTVIEVLSRQDPAVPALRATDADGHAVGRLFRAHPLLAACISRVRRNFDEDIVVARFYETRSEAASRGHAYSVHRTGAAATLTYAHSVTKGELLRLAQGVAAVCLPLLNQQPSLGLGLGLEGRALQVVLLRLGANTAEKRLRAWSQGGLALPGLDFATWLTEVERRVPLQFRHTSRSGAGECVQLPRLWRQNLAVNISGFDPKAAPTSDEITADTPFCRLSKAAREEGYFELWAQLEPLFVEAEEAAVSARVPLARPMKDVQEALRVCYTTCDAGALFGSKASALGKLKVASCSALLQWLVPLAFNSRRDAAHFYVPGNARMLENACFWGQCLPRQPAHAVLSAGFRRYFRRPVENPSPTDPSALEREPLFAGGLSETPIHKLLNRGFAMAADGRATVWVEHGGEVTALRDTLRTLAVHNPHVTEIDIRVPTLGFFSAAAAVENLYFEWQTTLCAFDGRAGLAPYSLSKMEEVASDV